MNSFLGHCSNACTQSYGGVHGCWRLFFSWWGVPSPGPVLACALQRKVCLVFVRRQDPSTTKETTGFRCMQRASFAATEGRSEILYWCSFLENTSIETCFPFSFRKEIGLPSLICFISFSHRYFFIVHISQPVLSGTLTPCFENPEWSLRKAVILFF